VIAISSDRPSGLQDSLRKHDLGYTLLSDSGMRAARAFGIAWQVDDHGVAMYKRAGIDLEVASGETHHQLPVPSVFLVGRDGRIQYVYSNPDYQIRPDNDTLLRAARKAAETELAPPGDG
jgi:peroxiredoxin